VADIFAERAECDVMLVGSGSIRVKKLGPVVTLKDFLASFPYDDGLTLYKITGKDLKTCFEWIMRPQNRDGEGECYQVNQKVKAIYSEKEKKLLSLTLEGAEIKDAEHYTICFQNYHFNSCQAYLNLAPSTMIKAAPPKVITTSAQEVFEEYLRTHTQLDREIEGRLVFKKD